MARTMGDTFPSRRGRGPRSGSRAITGGGDGGRDSRGGAVCRAAPRTGAGAGTGAGTGTGAGGGEDGSGGEVKSKVGSAAGFGRSAVTGPRRRPVRSSAWSRARIVPVRNAW